MFRYSTPCVTRSTFLLALPPLPCVHPSLVQLSRTEGLVFLATRVFALLARHACSRIRCPLYDYAFVFCSIFFFPRFIFTSFPPSFLCKYSARSYFCFSSPLPPSPLSRWKIKCENVVEKERWGGGDFNRLNRASREGGRGKRVSRFV